MNENEDVNLYIKPTGQLYIKIYQYLVHSTVLDPMAALKVTNNIIELIQEYNKEV